MDPTTPFEWNRLFWGEQPPLYLLEIVFRVVVIYAVGLLILSASGKRSRRELTSFDLMIVIALGSAVGDALFYPTVAIVYAIIVLVVVVLLQRLTAWLQVVSSPAQRFCGGRARLLIRDGDILESALRKETLSKAELLSMLREAGIDNTREVRRAYLELSGDLGVIRNEDDRNRVVGKSTLPATDADR